MACYNRIDLRTFGCPRKFIIGCELVSVNDALGLWTFFENLNEVFLELVVCLLGVKVIPEDSISFLLKAGSIEVTGVEVAFVVSVWNVLSNEVSSIFSFRSIDSNLLQILSESIVIYSS